jgi:hypothetical protein
MTPRYTAVGPENRACPAAGAEIRGDPSGRDRASRMGWGQVPLIWIDHLHVGTSHGNLRTQTFPAIPDAIEPAGTRARLRLAVLIFVRKLVLCRGPGSKLGTHGSSGECVACSRIRSAICAGSPLGSPARCLVNDSRSVLS